MLTRRNMLIASVMGLGATSLGLPLARANDWRDKFSTLNFGVVSRENEADHIAGDKAFVAYLEGRLRNRSKCIRPGLRRHDRSAQSPQAGVRPPRACRLCAGLAWRRGEGRACPGGDR